MRLLQSRVIAVSKTLSVSRRGDSGHMPGRSQEKSSEARAIERATIDAPVDRSCLGTLFIGMNNVPFLWN